MPHTPPRSADIDAKFAHLHEVIERGRSETSAALNDLQTTVVGHYQDVARRLDRIEDVLGLPHELPATDPPASP